jgi:hypothetical protein
MKPILLLRWLGRAALASSMLPWALLGQGAPIPSSPTATATRTNEEIVIDGRITEAAWGRAIALERFSQREPVEGEPVSERTVVRILYDPAHLYIAIRCFDSRPDLIVANEMRRDIFLRNNDCIEIYLDTFHDHRTAFFFSTNALGAQRDGLLTADRNMEEQNWDWNGVWENVSTKDTLGWTAEIAIPFKTLRFRAEDDEPWGMNIARIIPRKREESYWSPVLREYGFSAEYRISAYGHLTGLRDLRHPSNIFLKPYALAGVRRSIENSPPSEGVFELGLDAKVLVTSNLTLDLSVNTDFAQVEADQEQVNLTRFELFFPEKREFFLEGAGLFRFGERFWSPFLLPSLFYFSRRIGLSEDNEPVPLLGGAKLTGKIGSMNLGFLNMVADRTSYTNDDDEFVEIPRTNYTVLRLRQDVLENSSVGFMGLNKQSLETSSYNRGLGLDGDLYLTRNIRAGGFLAKTYSPDLRGEDFAGYIDLLYNSDLFFGHLSQNSIQDNFNPEMGFFPRTGVRMTHLNLGVGPRPDFLNLRQVFFFGDFVYISDQAGKPQTRQYNPGIYAVFQDGSSFFTLVQTNFELLTEDFEIHEDVIILPGEYRFTTLIGEYRSDQSRWISALLNWNIGQFYDGTIRGIGAGIDLKTGSRFTSNILYGHNRVQLSAGSFTTDLVSLRMLYTFSPRMFLKAFIQWNSDGNTVIANILFNFIHTPGSDLFLVYNEEISGFGTHPVSENRALLLKFTYLFDF